MVEPTIYLLIAIADYAGIKDYTLYEGEDDDPDTEIFGDDVTPVNVDEEDEAEKNTEQKKPDDSSLSTGLLSRIKKELPSKIEEATRGDK